MAAARLSALGIVTTVLLGGCGQSDVPETATTATPAAIAVEVGSTACATCHAEETTAWRGSHHDLAMQAASDQTVLGNFAGATFSKDGVTSTFFRRDGKFWVRTDGADGKLADFPISHTFGVAPLQQYLVPFPDGRMQALSIAWDTRPASQGGQRWFHLHPDETIDAEDPLHWTKPAQNWNHMCAECHSTDLTKNYEADTDRFATTWSEMNVGCEACHGAGSNHVVWAKAGGAVADPKFGLVVQFPAYSDSTWTFVDGRPIAKRASSLPSPRVELENCGLCHARRGQIWAGSTPGQPLADTHRVALLDVGLYHADGQIDGEVFEYGSFLQSRMHAAGVTCTDCHDAHSAKLREIGNALCAKCHASQTFDVPQHTMHLEAENASQCVSCHMPEHLYMVVDGRRDHSFRVPRPDLTVKIGVPNACNGCHSDQTPQWAADAIAKHSGATRTASPHYGEALAAGRSDTADAPPKLRALITDPAAPAIARATALDLLAPPADDPVLRAALVDPDPLVRRSAAETLQSLAPNDRVQFAVALLTDRIRTVRMAAVTGLLGVPGDQVPTSAHAAAVAAIAEFRASQQINADRAEGQLNLATLAMVEGAPQAAERAYRTALLREPASLPAYVNLADFLRRLGREDEAERTLRDALALAPEDATLRHALGLSLVRQRRLPDAVHEFAKAHETRPDDARFAYVYAVALHESGGTALAIQVLAQAQKQHPNNAEITNALGSFAK